METDFVVEKRYQYLYLVVKGRYNRVGVRPYAQMIVQACEKSGLYKILVNALEVEGTDLPTMERYFIGELVAEELPSKIKIAVTWPAPHINNFAETVAINRGGFIRVFGDIESAEKWLLTPV